ncbi:MAG: ketol-acid reductoisomerase [SAR324 cluster bacterium]|nr:ketol-acid reductoisomerase [SAR324 cluster bacterium]
MKEANEFIVYYDKDANTNLLAKTKLAVIGFGSQGHAHALNLKDSGFNVVVGLHEASKSIDKVKKAGVKVLSVAEATKWADMVMLLAPDQHHGKIYNDHIKDNLSAGNILAFGHGFSIHYGQIVPPKDVDVVMIAPKGPGHLVRRTYQQNSGVPCIIAVQNDASGKAKEYALAWAKAIGATKAGAILTTFKDETETDLFGEQAVLCGGTVELIKAGFDTLVEAGYPPHIAYFECLHEMKLIVDLIYEGGFSKMNHSISDTAKYGEYISGPKIIDKHVRKNMKKVLTDIQNGSFSKRWLLENSVGMPEFNALHKKTNEHPIEKIGAKLRSMFSWLK